jgi:CDP-2,3-bis-(O-geranylgeranyl)-sn-glycerol synthase
MDPILILKCQVLLACANGVPVLAKKLFGPALTHPVDGGLLLWDGRRLFGPSKTLRGVLLAIAAAMACGELTGLGLTVGAVFGTTSMIGDLLSSFVKRRLDQPPSSQATGLDQIPESLLPLLAGSLLLPLSALDIAVGTIVFLVGEILLSRVLHRVGIRDEPY